MKFKKVRGKHEEFAGIACFYVPDADPRCPQFYGVYGGHIPLVVDLIRKGELPPSFSSYGSNILAMRFISIQEEGILSFPGDIYKGDAELLIDHNDINRLFSFLSHRLDKYMDRYFKSLRELLIPEPTEDNMADIYRNA